MKTLIISDLHSNDAALKAVLKEVRRKGIRRVICLGDFVGYGAEPNPMLERIRTFKGRKVFIRGNHDRVAAGFDEGADFNQTARAAALWTRDQLSPANRQFLETLPVGPIVEDQMLLCHGSPDDEDEYLFSELDVARILFETEAPIVLFGHTHLPVFFSIGPEGELDGGLVRGSRTFELDPRCRYLINPGSVGQPRDRNPLASFAVYEPEQRRLHFVRIPYDIAATQLAILKAGLPPILADRLSLGF